MAAVSECHTGRVRRGIYHRRAFLSCVFLFLQVMESEALEFVWFWVQGCIHGDGVRGNANRGVGRDDQSV